MGLTFTDLKTKLGDWLALDTARLADSVRGDLLNLAQRELLRKYDLRFGEFSDTFATVVSTYDYALPTGWSRPHTLWYTTAAGGQTFLRQLSKEEFDAEFPDTAKTAEPGAYTVWGDKLRLGKTPSSVLTINRNYYRVLPDLGSLDQSGQPIAENEFTKNAWEAIFFRALVEATKYLIEDPRASLWEEKARAAELHLVLEHSRARHSGRQLVMEEPG
jgi:hypothetical protein